MMTTATGNGPCVYPPTNLTLPCFSHTSDRQHVSRHQSVSGRHGTRQTTSLALMSASWRALRIQSAISRPYGGFMKTLAPAHDWASPSSSMVKCRLVRAFSCVEHGSKLNGPSAADSSLKSSGGVPHSTVVDLPAVQAILYELYPGERGIER